MKIAVLDDYQDAVRKLDCFSLLQDHEVKVFNNTVKGVGQLAARVADVEAIVLIRERTRVTRQLLDRLPKLKIISQTGRVSRDAGGHIDLEACTDKGVVVLEGKGSPVAPAELTWALVMAAQRRIPQYVASLKHGAWQQSGLKSTTMPPNFGIGRVLKGQTLGIFGYGKIGQLVAGYGRAFGMNVLVWGRENSKERARADGFVVAESKDALFEQSDVLSVHLRLNDETRGIVTVADLTRMKPTALFVNTSRAELVEENGMVTALNRAARAWRPSTCSRPSPSCRATRCCAWRTASARRTSATWSAKATRCTSASPSRTSSTSCRGMSTAWPTRPRWRRR